MPTTARIEHLDQLLTGLAMFEAFSRRDAETLETLTRQVPPREAVGCLLQAMEVMTGIFAAQLRINPSEITSSIRRRVIREIATTSAKKKL